MCVVSMVMDHYWEKWKTYPAIPTPFVPLPIPHVWPPYNPYPVAPPVPQPFIAPEEVEEFRKLLERAREYDRKNNEPDCELDEKKVKLKSLAKELGVNIDFV